MYDIMYCSEREIYDEIMGIVKGAYPDATIEDASDEIHSYRFSVDTTDEVGIDEWLRFVMKEKLAGISLHLEVQMRDAEGNKKIRSILEEQKAKPIVKGRNYDV